MAIYVVTFLMSTLAQFFAPAEAATIPLLVGEDLLLPANSLFTLTMAISQVIGLLILGPLATSLLQVQGGFTLSRSSTWARRLPSPRCPWTSAPRAAPIRGLRLAQVWTDFREGWHFVTARRKIQSTMAL